MKKDELKDIAIKKIQNSPTSEELISVMEEALAVYERFLKGELIEANPKWPWYWPVGDGKETTIH